MRRSCIAIATVLAFISGSNSVASDCGVDGNNVSSSTAHSYELTVTSTSGDPVKIAGSVALMGPDSYLQINAETPYRLTVSGVNLLFIVSTVESTGRIDFSLSVDGRVSTSGDDKTMYAVGEDMPKSRSSFSASYKAVGADG